jgi:hypothetical protein
MKIVKYLNLKKILPLLIMFIMVEQLSLLNSAEARRPRKKKSPPISEALKELTWGESHFKVMKYIEKLIKKRYKTAISSSFDGLKADKLRREMKAEIDSLKDHYVEFNGQRTGYAVTFIKDDFAQNNGETMLKFDEGSRQRYFFFRYDELWKIVVSYPVMPDSSFESFLKQVQGKYGRAKKQDWETPHGGGRHLVRALWEDDKTRLVLENKASFYGCYVMKLVSRVKGNEITKLHNSKKKAGKVNLDEPQKIGGGNIDIFGEEEEVDGVVDQITGTQHEVKLDRVNFVPVESENLIKETPRKPRK